MNRVGLLALTLAGFVGCTPDDAPNGATGPDDTAGPSTDLDPLIAIDLDQVPEPSVRDGIGRARDEVIADRQSAAAWGRYGDWLNQYSYSVAAAHAYAEAARLDPDEFLWSYRHACVLGPTDPDGALASVNAAIALDDRYAPAHVRRAALELELGHEEAARTSLIRAVELDPDLVPARLALGRLELAAGHAELAREPLEFVAGARPELREVHELLARLHHTLGNTDTAGQHLAIARDLPRQSLHEDPRADVALGPVSSRDHVNEGARLAAQRNYPAAIQHFQEALRLNEGLEEASYNLALAYIDNGLPEDAIRVLRQGLVHNPDSEKLGVKLGDQLILLERYEEATEHFEDLVTRVDSWLAHKQLGFLYGYAGNVGKSMEQTSLALELNPESADLWYDHGLQVLTGQGREQAIPEFQKALSLNPDMHKARYRLAIAYLGEEQFDLGIQTLRELLERKPDHPDAFRDLLFAHERAGNKIVGERPQEAIEHYDEILALQPEPRFQRKLAWLLSTHPDPEIRNPSRALELARLVAPEGSTDPMALSTLAAAHAANEQYDQAIELGRRARQIALDQDMPRIARRIRDHLAAYKKRQPFLEDPADPEDPERETGDDG